MPKRDVVLKEQIAEAKDREAENNHFQSLQTQCNLLTKDLAWCLKKIEDAGI